jgi:chromosome segregation ATPase
MTKTCISCKRDIAAGQSQCYICSAPQNIIRFYSRTILFSLLLAITVIASAYWYFQQQSINQLEGQTANFTLQQKQSEQQIEQLQQNLKQVHLDFNNLQQSNSNNSSQAEEQVSKFNLELKAAVEASEKSQARSSWLSKENSRFKAKIAELEVQLSSKDPQSEQESSLKKQSILNQMMEQSKTEKNQLTQLISEKTAELESQWASQTGDTTTPLTPQVRNEQLTSATGPSKQRLEEIEVIIRYLATQVEADSNGN